MLGVTSSMFRVVDVLCAAIYTVAEYEWIFPLCYGFFPVCHGLRLCNSLSDPWCYLQTPCVSADFFLSVVDFFPVIHSWAFVHQSSIFKVVDVLCAVSYAVAEAKWIFMDFFLCAIVSQ